MRNGPHGAPKDLIRARSPSSPRIVTGLVVGAVSILPPAQRKRYEEEWEADLSEIKGKWRRLWWALGIRFYSAHVLRRLHARVPREEDV